MNTPITKIAEAYTKMIEVNNLVRSLGQGELDDLARRDFNEAAGLLGLGTLKLNDLLERKSDELDARNG